VIIQPAGPNMRRVPIQVLPEAPVPVEQRR
jgi:hypothetical protein